ncbi:MAG: DUF1684 domain-containing protein [Acidobacteriia bacterium]|nr:DUF1684 domain-containing protein [Terriglobia bacterium]MYG04895.1 DUF1684 domain-containing protein [Terriglobia bacterium]MYK09345.1 DUF1684 domain-containing protein [Terriglobia bacterium]
MTTRLPAAAIPFLAMLLACGTPSPHDYAAEIEAWRIEREARLKADDGWLTLTGLFFLGEGDTSFGSSPQNDIELRAGPERSGIITLQGGRVSVRAVEGQTLLVDGRRVDAAQLWPYEGSDRPTITLGPLSLFCHESGDRMAMRLRDLESEIRREFTKLRWYPVDESFRISGRYVPHDEPRTVGLANNLGDVLTLRSSGSVALTVKGQALLLTAIDYDDRLWFVFSDLTSGSETYPAARFLYADIPDLDGMTTVDFNRAYNPPCAFNPYTTCPLPPPENRLQIRIEAGELDYPGRR